MSSKKMKFNKSKFLENASADTKKRLKNHIDTLDGMEVDFEGSGYTGIIRDYEIEGNPFYLYPVYECWCE